MADGRIVAVGDRADVESWIGPDTETVELGDGCVMPGLVEAHGHPLMEAIVLADRMVDIRPVTMRERRRRASPRSATRSPPAAQTGAYLNGWDPLLQVGLPEPTLAWLDAHGARHPAGDHPQLRAQGVLQLRGRAAARPDPRHPRPEGREVRPRRQRRTRRHRRGDRRGVPADRRRDRPERLPGDAARRVRPAEPGRADDVLGDGVRPDVPAGARRAARRPHRAAAHLRDVDRGDDDRPRRPTTATTSSGRSASRSGSTGRRGSATSTCRSRTWTPTPPAPSA